MRVTTLEAPFVSAIVVISKANRTVLVDKYIAVTPRAVPVGKTFSHIHTFVKTQCLTTPYISSIIIQDF